MRQCIYSVLLAVCVFHLEPLKAEETLDTLIVSNLFQIDDSLLRFQYPKASVKIQKPVQHKAANFSHTLELQYTPISQATPYYLIIVPRPLYVSLSSEIKRYAEDVHAIYGYGIYLETTQEASPEQIKYIIQSHGSNLCGCIFIGDLGEALYEVQNDYNEYGYRVWPCDLFFMDLDGIWIDSDGNGVYDSHSGNVEPEIFFGRLSAKGMSVLGSEEELIRKQLKKSHDFWWKNSFHSADSVLNYIDHDWCSFFPSFQLNQIFANGVVEDVRYCNGGIFSPTNYISRLTNNGVGFIHLASHSSPSLHAMTNGYVYLSNILQNSSASYAFNLFCCSACNWLASSSQGYLGGAYLFNNGNTISVIGSTKTGSTRDPATLFYSLASMSTGKALLNWWKLYNGNSHDATEVYWSYGMTLLGDPTLFLKHRVSQYCVSNLTLTSFPSSNESNLVLYRAENSITITENFVIPIGVHVIFDAPNVVFSPGFSCPVGATFETRSEGCEL